MSAVSPAVSLKPSGGLRRRRIVNRIMPGQREIRLGDSVGDDGELHAGSVRLLSPYVGGQPVCSR